MTPPPDRPSRWIVMSGVHPDAGSEMLAFHVAQKMASRSHVLFWDVASCIARSAKTVKDLLPFRKAFSTPLLRNFLSQESTSFSILQGPLEINPPAFQETVSLLKSGFDFLLILAPATWRTEFLSLLDEAHLALLITDPSMERAPEVQRYFDQLALHKYPQALCQVVLNRVPHHGLNVLEAFTKVLGRPPLAAVPVKAFVEHVRVLARQLEDRGDLYGLPREVSAESALAVKNRIHQRLLEATASEVAPSPEKTQTVLENLLSEEADLPSSREIRGRLFTDLLHDVLGFGPLEALLRDPEVAEIMVNGPGVVFIEKKGRLFPAPVSFENETQLRTVIDRIVAPIGRRVDESLPLCDARLPDGSRVNIVLPPLALDGPALTIRKFMEKRLTLEDLLGFGALDRKMADFLTRCVKMRKNIIISGGTGSGKTTLLNILSGLIAPDERIVTIEDAAELKLQQPHVVRLESRPANSEGQGAIPIRRLVMNALRMRPDRIVVGECRGGEAFDMLQAMNTGHDGSLTTLHANSPRDAMGRLEALVLMAGIDLPVRVVREQIKSAVDMIVQIARLSDGSRKILSLTELTGMEGDVLTTAELFRYHAGVFEETGLVSQWE